MNYIYYGGNMNEFDKLKGLIDRAQYITALTGAGISTLSGIPDFRGEANPVWDKYPQDKVFDSAYFKQNPGMFYDFLREILAKEYQPNVAHRVLRHLEDAGKLKAVITQNIDGLHQLAGSRKVYELHGSIYRSHCVKCGKEAKYADFIKKVYMEKIPRCACEGVIKPDIVFYGEMLPEEDMSMSVFHASRSDLMIVVGTSLAVQPAAFMPMYTLKNSGRVALINRGETYIDDRAAVKMGEIGETFEKLGEYLEI
jgi:NAD-dependent deacetylase